MILGIKDGKFMFKALDDRQGYGVAEEYAADIILDSSSNYIEIIKDRTGSFAKNAYCNEDNRLILRP